MIRRHPWQDGRVSSSETTAKEDCECSSRDAAAAEAEAELDFDPQELLEFLAADDLDVGADPLFRERLRRELWRRFLARFDMPSGLLPH